MVRIYDGVRFIVLKEHVYYRNSEAHNELATCMHATVFSCQGTWITSKLKLNLTYPRSRPVTEPSAGWIQSPQVSHCNIDAKQTEQAVSHVQKHKYSARKCNGEENKRLRLYAHTGISWKDWKVNSTFSDPSKFTPHFIRAFYCRPRHGSACYTVSNTALSCVVTSHPRDSVMSVE